MPPTTPPSPLKSITRSLLEKIGDLDTAAGDPTNPNFKAALDSATKLWEQLQDLTKGAKTSTIVDFFNAIGSGVIDAQKQLDQASEKYIRGALQLQSTPATAAGAGTAAASPPLLGSMFRIPRVTAELKCSLETDHEKRLNVILYSDRTDVHDFHQQTVQLEVVAVPVPPDYLNFIRRQPPAPAAGPAPTGKTPLTFAEPADSQPSEPEQSAQTTGPLAFSPIEDEGPEPPTGSDKSPRSPADPPGPAESAAWLQSFLADAATREETRALVEKLDAQKGAPRRSPVRKLLLPAWAQALVLTDGNNARFIGLAVNSKRPRLLLWQLLLRPASLQLLYKLPAPADNPTGPDLSRLQRVIARLGESQAAAGRARR